MNKIDELRNEAYNQALIKPTGFGKTGNRRYRINKYIEKPRIRNKVL